MKKPIYLALLCVLIAGSTSPLLAQQDLIKFKESIETNRNFHDLSDPYRPSISVTIWGAVSEPGIYKLLKGTSLFELFSYAGGLQQTVQLDGIRILRHSSTDSLIILDLSGIYNEDDHVPVNAILFYLEDNDIVILPKETLDFKEEFRYYLSLASTLTSLIYLAYIIFGK